MNAKLMIAICCVAVLGASTMVGAHLTNPAGSATAKALTGDDCRSKGTLAANLGACPVNAGVSGTYVTGGAAVRSTLLFPLTVNPLAVVCPAGYCATGNALCDLEVVNGSGRFGAPAAPNEAVVDNTPTMGLVPDGTWDDGGIDAACHVPTGNYPDPAFNNHSGDCTGDSRAKDAVSGGGVWISPSCDSASQVASPGLATCFVNGVLAANVNTLEGCVLGPEGLVASLQCAVPNACTAGAGGFLACGADGVADSANLGTGGAGVPYPGVDTHCLPGDGVGATFVFNGVALDGVLSIAPATTGWVDWSAGTGAVFPTGPGITVDLCALAPLPSPPC